MKKLFVCFSILALIDSGYAQTPVWSKAQQEAVINEGLNLLAPFKGISAEQKESMAICYLDAIKERYTAEAYAQTPELILKRERSATLESCSKKIGVVLKMEEEKKEEPKKEEAPKNDSELNVTNLSGTWLYESESFNFSESGNYLYEASTRKCNGLWTLTGKTIALQPSDNIANKFALCKAEEYSIVKFSGNELVILKAASNKKYTLKRIN